MKKSELSKVYLRAAELLFESYEEYRLGLNEFRNHEIAYTNTFVSRFSCDCIGLAAEHLFSGMDGVRVGKAATQMYEEYFKSEDANFAWWPLLEGCAWDYESRLIALLLMSEIAKDLDESKS